MNAQEQLHILQTVARALNGLNQLLAARALSVKEVGTFASLPASPNEGMLAGVTDSTTATWGATISGGGTNHVLAYYDGTAWTVAGK